MLFVLGAGSFTPEQALTDNLLRELGTSTVGAVSALRRHTTLDIELLRANKNSDLQGALKSASPTCTDMGEKAARQAIERAGIPVEQIGLVIGDCATPIEVTPSEGQRVAGRLGLKVPAYDIYSTNGVCPAHLSILSTWRPERLPRYILCVSTNAPTQRIDYSTGEHGATYSDGASACVISAEDRRGLEMVWNEFKVDTALKPTFELDTLGYLARLPVDSSAARVQAGEIFGALKSSKLLGEESQKIYWPMRDGALQSTVLKEYEVRASAVINDALEFGDMLGSNSFFGLSRDWDSLKPGQLVGVIVAEGSVNYGGAMFRVQEARS